MKIQNAISGFALIIAIFCSYAQAANPSTASPADWPNAFIHKNGNGSVTIWSDILTIDWNNLLADAETESKVGSQIAHYANCISDRNEGFFLGNRDRVGGALDGPADCPSLDDGVAPEYEKHLIIDSDAIRACKKIGGELPSVQDFADLGEDGAKMPHDNSFVWTTKTGWGGDALMLSPAKGTKDHLYVGREAVSMGATRCVSHQ